MWIAIILLIIGLIVGIYLGKTYYSSRSTKIITFILIILASFFAAWLALKYAQDGLWDIRPTSSLWTGFILSSVIALISYLRGGANGCGDSSCACNRGGSCSKGSKIAGASAAMSAGSAVQKTTHSSSSHGSATFTGTADDLKKVEGIGPVIENHLNTNGIHTFEQLADADPIHLRSILDLEGDRFISHHPETRPAQSALARDGQWDKLKIRQDELDGGRVK